ncbi:MAG: hypothetical protein ABI444_07310 [Candidatus Kapaibacterium sp.]|jgi:predicted nucleic acid-binding protein
MSSQLLIETDVLADFLITPNGERSLLRSALTQSVCYTTMVNALELFRATRSESENAAVLGMLNVVRVLGFNARFAQTFSEVAREIETRTSKQLTDREAMIVGMAKASKLSILTVTLKDRYESFESVAVLDTKAIAALREEVPNSNDAQNISREPVQTSGDLL